MPTRAEQELKVYTYRVGVVKVGR